MKRSNNTSKYVNGYAASVSAEVTNQKMQWSRYHNPKGGHGFAAEDGNALYERLCGHKVKVVGMDNAKNGVDLVIDGVNVQLKYHKTAYGSVEACFDANGTFRYNGQKIMVPSDQYEEAVSLMRQKIVEGKVEGITNPDQAENIIKKGRITYEQSQKMRKCFTKESLGFDILTQTKVAGFVGGVSAANDFLFAVLTGEKPMEAAKKAGKAFCKAGGKTLVTGVTTQQFLRSEAGRKAAVVTTNVVRKGVSVACKNKVGKGVVGKMAQGLSGKVLKGAAAKNVVTKAVRGNILTNMVVYAVDSIPDTYRLCTGKISGKEFVKRRAVSAGGSVGGSVGYFAGMAVGTAILPVIGTTVGGFIGGICGGWAGSEGVMKLIKLL